MDCAQIRVLWLLKETPFETEVVRKRFLFTNKKRTFLRWPLRKKERFQSQNNKNCMRRAQNLPSIKRDGVFFIFRFKNTIGLKHWQ